MLRNFSPLPFILVLQPTMQSTATIVYEIARPFSPTQWLRSSRTVPTVSTDLKKNILFQNFLSTPRNHSWLKMSGLEPFKSNSKFFTKNPTTQHMQKYAQSSHF
jgi:hypothetical protein